MTIYYFSLNNLRHTLQATHLFHTNEKSKEANMHMKHAITNIKLFIIKNT